MPSYYTEHILKLKQPKLKAPLTDTEINSIVTAFKHLVCKIKKDAVVIKHQKFGYELFRSKADDKYWAYALTFTEPLNPLKPIYKHHWIGNAFIGYGYDTLEETINQTFKMMEQGPTAQTNFRDYLTSWDEEKDRILLGWEEKEWSFEKYQKFQRWYEKNKVKIMAKQIGVKDAEYYNKEINDKNNRSGLAVLLGKMQDPPKRPRSMAVVMRETAKTKEKWDDPKTKKYLVGFMYVN
ncbi:hypothetical protein [Spiroplasma endosymbiont of Poecilobothrus nobilitatus]|uniref:hypothetical protein n=1 Tax=Spiroplasma endosymbiont of Poecilobothrus nobilitatus TaxID=1209220 RepID=UPI00313AF8F1